MCKKIITLMLLTVLSFPQLVGAMPIFNRKENVIVITYHKISENPNEWSDYCIPPKMLKSDVEYLKSEGYVFMTATELADADVSKKRIAVLTFDDGYESDFEYAVPIIKSAGAKATFFVIGGAIGSEGYVSEQQLLEMSKENCVEIGSHSDKLHFKTYKALSDMYRDAKYENEIIGDYKNNDNLIFKITGKVPTSLSYPNGIYSSGINEKLEKRITFSTKETSFVGVLKNVPVGRHNRSYRRNIENILK